MSSSHHSYGNVSASSSSKSSQGSKTGIDALNVAKEKFADFFITLNNGKRFFGDSFLLLVFEIINLIIWSYANALHSFDWDQKVMNPIGNWLFGTSQPSIVPLSRSEYVGIYAATVSVFICMLIPPFYMFLSRSTNVHLALCSQLMLRIMRPFGCKLADLSFDVARFPGEKCYMFPFLAYIILSIIFLPIFLIVIALDTLLVLDKFKSIGSFTATPDGRLQFLVLFGKCNTILFHYFLKWFRAPEDSFICTLSGFLYTCFLLCLILRQVPFFSVLYSYIYTSLMVVKMCVSLGATLGSITHSHYTLTSYTIFIIAFPVVMFLLTVRYTLLYLHFGRRKLKSDFFVCYSPQDVVVGIYVRERIKARVAFIGRRRCCCCCCSAWFGKKMNGRVGNNGSGGTRLSSSNIMEVIGALLDDESFKKTKCLCQNLVSLVIENNPVLAQAILNHASTIFGMTLPDSLFCLKYYSYMANIAMSSRDEYGEQGRAKKGKGRMMTELGRAGKYQKELGVLFINLFQELSSDDRRVSFSDFAKILTTIQAKQEFCETIYSKMVRTIPSSLTYRRYATFLIKFVGDHRNGRIFLRESQQLEHSKMKRHKNHDTSNMYDSHADDDDDNNNNNSNRFQENEEEEVDRNSAIAEVDTFTDGGSVNTFQTQGTNFLGSSDEVSHLSQKINRRFYVSAFCTQLLCCLFLSLTVVSIISIVVLSFLMQSRYRRYSEVIESTVSLQKDISKITLFNRKLQVSYYDSSETPFDWERSSADFVRIKDLACENGVENLNSLFVRMDSTQKRMFTSEKLQVIDHVAELNEDPKNHEYEFLETNLFDSVSSFLMKCENMQRLDEDVYNFNISSNGTVGNRLVDTEEFISITMNEYNISEGMSSIVGKLLERDKSVGFNFIVVYITIPSVLCVLYVLIMISYCCMSCQLRNSFKGLLLIPKDQLHHLQNRYLRDQVGISNSGQVRAPTESFSLPTQICLKFCAFLTILILVILTFTVLLILTEQSFNRRNNEYRYTLKIESMIHRVHLWTVEVMYRDDSLFTTEEVIEYMGSDIEMLIDQFYALRFGDSDLGLKGIDGSSTYELFHKSECSHDGDHFLDLFAEGYECKSLTEKVELVIESAKRLLHTLEHLNGTFERELRSSDDFMNIILLDNFSNGTNFNKGAVTDDLKELSVHVANSVNLLSSYLESFSLFLAFLFFPLFLFSYCLCFCRMYVRLRRNLNMVRKIMMLMKKEILMSKNIYDYVSGKSSFAQSFHNEKRNRIDEIFDILQISHYGFICFDSSFSIVRYNNTSEELFRIKANGSTSMTQIFTESSILEVKRWVRRNLKTSFNGELTAIYDDQEYCVLADISRHPSHRLFVGIFENLESSKKKDLLKQNERRNQKLDLLLRNILPDEIAKKTRLDDFEMGKCVVWEHKKATIYFSDIANFTYISRISNPHAIISMLHTFFGKMDDLCKKHKMEKIKTIGDCYFCVSGIPTYKPLHAHSAMDFAIDAVRESHSLKDFFSRKCNEGLSPMKPVGNDVVVPQHNNNNNSNNNVNNAVMMMSPSSKKRIEREMASFDFQIRTGLSSGKVIAAIIGKSKRCYDVWGECVNEAARMESHGIPGKIQVSRSTYECIFDKYDFMEREVQLQGIGTHVLAYVHTPSLHPDNSNNNNSSNNGNIDTDSEGEEIIVIKDGDSDESMLLRTKKLKEEGEEGETVMEEYTEEEEEEEEKVGVGDGDDDDDCFEKNIIEAKKGIRGEDMVSKDVEMTPVQPMVIRFGE